MPYPIFNRSQLKLESLSKRIHDMSIDTILPLDAQIEPFFSSELETVANRIVKAHIDKTPVIVMMGAHVIRKGNSNFINDLIKRKIFTHIGVNGACVIHDYELSKIGATTESVARYISEGQFGLWKETGEINDIVKEAAKNKLGLGEAIGKAIEESNFPFKNSSIFANAYKFQVPITVHVSIGQDIIHEHPNFDGASFGQTSYQDFLIFAHSVQSLQYGVFINYGTAVMGPEVYLKALSMARNVAHQKGERIAEFTTAVFDIQELGGDYHVEESKTNPNYYFRPYKTILVRTIQDGGESFYIQGDHRITFPNLYRLIINKLKEKENES